MSDRPIPTKLVEYAKLPFRLVAPKTPGELDKLLRKAIAYINWFIPVNRERLSASSLRLVIARSSGYDHIDVDAARDLGICVANQPEIIAEAVAQYTVAGILAVSRQLVAAHKVTWEWDIEGWPDHLAGRLVTGRSLGLLGAGRIGQAVAVKLRALGVGEVYYYSRSRKPCLEAGLGARKVSLEELFTRSEILVNSLPLTPETRGLVTASLLSLLPQGAIYVNVGRGGTEKPGAVERIAKRRKDLGFFLDVYPREPLTIRDERLLIADGARVILSPHRAGYSKESLYGTSLLALLQARDYIEKGCVWNPVNKTCKQCAWGPPPLGEIVRTLHSLHLL